MLSDDPKLVGSRLSALLGNPVQQTPHVATGTSTKTTSFTTTPPSQSRRNSARNSAVMVYPIYEPQSQRPYTPETEPEIEEESDAHQFPGQPALPTLPTTPAPVYVNPSASLPLQQEEEQQLQHRPSIPPPPPEPTHSTSSPNFASSPTLNGTPNPHTPLYSNKPSFQSHRTLSSTTSSLLPASDLECTHTSNNPFSPFYMHPTTRTSLEVDRAGIKALSPNASTSKTAIISVHPILTSVSDLDASLSSLNPPSYPPSHPSSTYERTRRQRESCAVYPHGLRQHQQRRYGSHGLVAFATRSGRGGGGSQSQSCELLRLECEKRRGVGRRGRWQRWCCCGGSPRQRLVVKLLLGVLIVGGVVGLAVGLWWRFARLQGGAATG